MGTYAESFDPAVTDAARAWILTSLQVGMAIKAIMSLINQTSQAGYRHLDTAAMYSEFNVTSRKMQ